MAPTSVVQEVGVLWGWCRCRGLKIVKSVFLRGTSYSLVQKLISWGVSLSRHAQPNSQTPLIHYHANNSLTNATSLSIFCCRLKSHLLSLSYSAFWLFTHLYSARAVIVILDTPVVRYYILIFYDRL